MDKQHRNRIANARGRPAGENTHRRAQGNT